MENYDEGLARNISKLFGYGDLFKGMGGKPLQDVQVAEDKERIIFTFSDASTATFKVEGDCCSHSWIEHCDIPPSVIGQEIVEIYDNRVAQEDDAEGGDLLQVYKTTFRTLQGDIVLEYRNSSNGYYGGYLIRIA